MAVFLKSEVLIINWLEIKIFTSSNGIEEVSNCLFAVGVSGFEIEDKEDFENFLENNKQFWDYVDEDLIKQKGKETCIKVYLNDDLTGKEQLALIEDKINELKNKDVTGLFGRLLIEQNTVNDEDWANSWKQYYKPFKVGERLIICPIWEEYLKKENEIVLKIDPGMAFGTGTHESTRLCLEAIQKCVVANIQVLDLGCGSGILSIASLLFGAKSAVAVDIDSLAVKISLENAKLNGFNEESYLTFEGNIINDNVLKNKISLKKYDIIFANIVADVIIALAPIFKELLNDNGILISSGIIDERKDEVILNLENNGLKIVETKEEKGWVCLICKCRM